MCVCAPAVKPHAWSARQIGSRLKHFVFQVCWQWSYWQDLQVSLYKWQLKSQMYSYICALIPNTSVLWTYVWTHTWRLFIKCSFHCLFPSPSPNFGRSGNETNLLLTCPNINSWFSPYAQTGRGHRPIFLWPFQICGWRVGGCGPETTPLPSRTGWSCPPPDGRGCPCNGGPAQVGRCKSSWREGKRNSGSCPYYYG